MELRVDARGESFTDHPASACTVISLTKSMQRAPFDASRLPRGR
jgi:hypothetical protein